MNITKLKTPVTLAGAFIIATIQLSTTRATTVEESGDSSYQFIISGYPAMNLRRNTMSAATGLTTGSYRVSSASDGLEARYRTHVMSNSTSLRSDKLKPMMIIMR